MEYFEIILKTILDCLEVCFDSFTLAAGKRIREVVLIIAILFILGLGLTLFKLPALISWQEGLTALVITVLISFINDVNASSINKFKNNIIQKGRKRFNHGR